MRGKTELSRTRCTSACARATRNQKRSSAENPGTQCACHTTTTNGTPAIIFRTAAIRRRTARTSRRRTNQTRILNTFGWRPHAVIKLRARLRGTSTSRHIVFLASITSGLRVAARCIRRRHVRECGTRHDKRSKQTKNERQVSHGPQQSRIQCA